MNTPTQNQTPEPATCAGPNCAVSTGSASVFELSENDERNDQYHTLGMFATLADAVAAVDKYGVHLCVVATESQESACVEIHEHRFGLRLRGQPVWTRKWVYDYDREHGDRWQLSEPNAAIRHGEDEHTQSRESQSPLPV